MRIKVSLSAPFNPSKVLLPVPEDIKTISQLKKHVRQCLSTVSACSSHWRELKLEVDGFELLGGSQLNVLEDGDVVTVALYPGSSRTDATIVKRDDVQVVSKRKAEQPASKLSKKRKTGKSDMGSGAGVNGRASTAAASPAKLSLPSKRSSAEVASAAKDSPTHETIVNGLLKHARRLSTSSMTSSSSESSSDSSDASSPSSSSSSSSSSASSSATSSSSSSTSSGDSTSSSSTSSSAMSSSSEALPRKGQSGAVSNRRGAQSVSSAPPVHVPPGHGKPETHDRNQRRRLARQHRLAALRAAEATATPAGLPEATATPNGAHSTLGPVTPRAASVAPSIPASLSSFVNGSTGASTKGHLAGKPPIAGPANTEIRQAVELPAAVSNRNKKKGFLKDMATLQRVRTTFGPSESIELDSNSSMDTSMPIQTVDTVHRGACADSSSFLGALDGGSFVPNGTSTPNGETPGRRRQRGGRRSQGGYKGNQVVPPSEREVPSNIFVTSQVFTAPRWDSGKRYEQTRDVTQLESVEADGAVAGNEDASGPLTATRVTASQPDAAGPNGIRNGYAQGVAPYPGANSSEEDDHEDVPYEPTPKELAWTKIEVAFDALEPLSVEALSSCGVGSTLGWKDVALNMETFTPEIALQLGRVVSAGPELRVRQLKRPIPVWSDEDGCWTLELDDGEEPAETTITSEDLQNDAERWKVVPNIMALALGFP